MLPLSLFQQGIFPSKNSSQCDCGPTDTIWPKLSRHMKIRVKWLISLQRVTSSEDLRVFPCEFKVLRINSMTLHYFLTVIAGKISLHSMNKTGRSHRSSKAASIQNKDLTFGVVQWRAVLINHPPEDHGQMGVQHVCWECCSPTRRHRGLAAGFCSALGLLYTTEQRHTKGHLSSSLSVLALCSWVEISVLNRCSYPWAKSTSADEWETRSLLCILQAYTSGGKGEACLHHLHWLASGDVLLVATHVGYIWPVPC